MNRRALLTWLARAAITALLLFWVFSRDDVREGLTTARYVQPWWLVGAVVAGGIAIMLASWRWHACLRACDCALPFGSVLRMWVAGNAAGLLSVGPLGVDAVRMALATRALPQRKGALLASITLDHVSAIPALAMLGAAIIGMLGLTAELNQTALRVLGIAIAATVVVGVVLQLLFPVWNRRALGYVFDRLRAPGTAKAVLISLPMLIAHYGVFWCAARALALPAQPFGLFGAAVVADTVASLPITIAGLGFREKTFELLMQQWYGVAPALSVKASLTGLAILALCAVAAVLVFPVRVQREPAVS